KKDTFTIWQEYIKRKRTVYRFGGVWTQSVLAAVPWLNVIIIVILLLALHGRIAVTPGVIFDLPAAPFLEGAPGGLTVLMLSVSREMLAEEETLVFFDDERYLIRDEEQALNLAARISESIGAERNRDILLLADKRVPHGDVMAFVNLACRAGATRINVAQKPD
ncbi:MAG: hypothetical protein FWG50_08065, partial [Kiritimatiellaeota bacterium]|nr:hypothetical protein [Kiritimatiellota bacterium]